MANFVYHHWVYTSTYWPLSYPLDPLVNHACVRLLSQSMDGFKLPKKNRPLKRITSRTKNLGKNHFSVF